MIHTMRQTQKLELSGIELPPPMDVVVNFFGGIFTWFLKKSVTVLATPLISEKGK